MLDLNESPFHDAALVKASQEIQAILDTVRPDAYGRQLSFLHTQMGTVLAWVRHDIEVPADAVRAASPNDEVIKALGIRTQQAAA